jgi:hypothetical protein
MKSLTLAGNNWKERIEITLSDEDKALLAAQSGETLAARSALLERLREESVHDADPEDVVAAQAIYDQHKIDGADLIAVDIDLPSGTGIINCRVSGEHKQIRF